MDTGLSFGITAFEESFQLPITNVLCIVFQRSNPYNFFSTTS